MAGITRGAPVVELAVPAAICALVASHETPIPLKVDVGAPTIERAFTYSKSTSASGLVNVCVRLYTGCVTNDHTPVTEPSFSHDAKRL